MGWLLGEYTEGVTGALLEVSAEVDWDVGQWEDYAAAMNDKLRGDTAARLAYSLLPPGTKAVLPQEVAERYKPDMDLFLIKLVAGDFGLPASEVGFTEAGALGASFHEGEEDILNRQTRRPDADWLGRIATRLMVRHNGMPPVLAVQVLGLESEDEAAADAVADARVRGGRMTLNQDNARRGEPPFDFEEADMPMVFTQRGIVFIEGASKTAVPGTLVGPPQAPPAGAPGQDGQQEGEPGDGEGQGEQQPPAQKALPPGKAAESKALKSWLKKKGWQRGGRFVCKELTADDVPDLVGTQLVSFAKADDAGPKALSGTGPAGSGTGSW
jgi:hypothetical protein